MPTHIPSPARSISRFHVSAIGLALLVLGGCDLGSPVALDGCLMDCGLGGGGTFPYGSTPMLSIIGIPRSVVDSSAGVVRLHVGDSLTVYAVRHVLDDRPCASRDTLRSAQWKSYGTDVTRVSAGTGGSGIVVAVSAGYSNLAVTDSAGAVTGGNLWSCGGNAAMYLSTISVVP